MSVFFSLSLIIDYCSILNTVIIYINFLFDPQLYLTNIKIQFSENKCDVTDLNIATNVHLIYYCIILSEKYNSE